jgi:hypothetical protein
LHNVEPKFIIDRYSKRVFIIKEGMLIDELNDDSWDYVESEANENKRKFSEISESTYMDFLTDAKNEMALKDIKHEIVKFAGIAKYINELWENLPPECNDILATEYPFDRGFDEISDAIQFWRETVFWPE